MQEDSPERLGVPSRAKQVLSNPWFGLVGLLIGVVGVALAVFFYLSSQTERELVYAVNPVRTAVVTAGRATELAVLHRGQPLGDVDVTAAQVAIWNAGTQSIRQENVLQDIVIFTVPSVPILEVSIRERSRDVTGFALVETPEWLAQGIVPVSWRILEGNDGASVQLIYQGRQEVQVCVRGVIEGTAGVKEARLGVTIKTPEEQLRGQSRMRQVWGILALLFGIITILSIVVVLIRPRQWRDLLNIIFALGLFGAATWQYFSISTGLWPPFGF